MSERGHDFARDVHINFGESATGKRVHIYCECDDGGFDLNGLQSSALFIEACPECGARYGYIVKPRRYVVADEGQRIVFDAGPLTKFAAEPANVGRTFRVSTLEPGR